MPKNNIFSEKKEEALKKIRAIIAVRLGIPEEEVDKKITPDTVFDVETIQNLGVDSLRLVKILMETEEVLQIDIDDDELKTIDTFKDFLACVAKKILRKEVSKKIKAIIAEVLETSEKEIDEKINSETVFNAETIRNLGADSLDIVEIIMETENVFEIDIEDDELEKMSTFGDFLDCVMKKLGQ